MTKLSHSFEGIALKAICLVQKKKIIMAFIVLARFIVCVASPNDLLVVFFFSLEPVWHHISMAHEDPEVKINPQR